MFSLRAFGVQPAGQAPPGDQMHPVDPGRKSLNRPEQVLKRIPVAKADRLRVAVLVWRVARFFSQPFRVASIDSGDCKINFLHGKSSSRAF